jgi:hypothetical protein
MAINQLPVELLQKIFMFYCNAHGHFGCHPRANHVHRRRPSRLVHLGDEDEEMEFGEGTEEGEEEESRFSDPQPLKRSTPIHLSIVCRYWRSITLSMPELWAFVDVQAPLEPRDVPIYEAWLARSRDELLNLSVCDLAVEQGRDNSGGDGLAHTSSSTSRRNNQSWEENKDALFAILQRAMLVRHRWKNVRFAVQEYDAGRMVFGHSSCFGSEPYPSSSSTAPIAPSLESFDITLRETGAASFTPAAAGGTGNGFGVGGMGIGAGMGSGVPLPPSLSSSIIHILCRALCQSPKLTGASWGAYVDREILTYVPFHRLQRLGLESISDRDAKQVLIGCRELKEITIGRYGPPSPSAGGALPSPLGLFGQLHLHHFNQQQQPQQHATMMTQIGNGSNDTITLPKLEIAVLNFVDEFPAPPTFFVSFLAPSLEELSLPYGFGDGLAPDDGWKALMRFLDRSGCTLRTLKFSDAVKMGRCEKSAMRRYLESRVFRGLTECSTMEEGP